MSLTAQEEGMLVSNVPGVYRGPNSRHKGVMDCGTRFIAGDVPERARLRPDPKGRVIVGLGNSGQNFTVDQFDVDFAKYSNEERRWAFEVSHREVAGDSDSRDVTPEQLRGRVSRMFELLRGISVSQGWSQQGGQPPAPFNPQAAAPAWPQQPQYPGYPAPTPFQPAPPAPAGYPAQAPWPQQPQQSAVQYPAPTPFQPPQPAQAAPQPNPEFWAQARKLMAAQQAPPAPKVQPPGAHVFWGTGFAAAYHDVKVVPGRSTGEPAVVVLVWDTAYAGSPEPFMAEDAADTIPAVVAGCPYQLVLVPTGIVFVDGGRKYGILAVESAVPSVD